ncbi:MAG: DNA repair protein RecO, partial [Chloroflexota bacterium]
MRVHVYKTEAIVLDRKDFGEADRLLTLYTPGMGKVRAIAKGARRTTSRLSGHLELFTHTSLVLVAGRNLDIVTQSQLIHSHERLREDLWRAALGFHIL